MAKKAVKKSQKNAASKANSKSISKPQVKAKSTPKTKAKTKPKTAAQSKTAAPKKIKASPKPQKTEEATAFDIIDLVDQGKHVYYLKILAYDDDWAEAQGQVWRAGENFQGENQKPEGVLSTNEPFRVMWGSPSGALWLASSNGVVATTALVKWDAPIEGLDSLAWDPSLKWKMSQLPLSKGKVLPPNLICLWGVDDQSVFAGSDEGEVFHWDGKQWACIFQSPEARGHIVAIGGAAGEVYVVESGRNLYRWDGKKMHQLKVPAMSVNEYLTCIGESPKGEILIATAGDGGRLFSAKGNDLKEIAKAKMDLLDMGFVGDRLLFATDAGVAEKKGNAIGLMKDSFKPEIIRAGHKGKKRLFFLEAEPEYPGFVVYLPEEADDFFWGVEFVDS